MSSEPNFIRPSDFSEVGAEGEDIRFQIDVRLRNDDVDVEVARVLPPNPRVPTENELRALACRIYDARRARDRMLDRNLFGEPAWDIMLALYGLPSRGEHLSVTAVSLAAAVPGTTGLRWQKTMIENGLIERISDPADGRRQFVQLTTHAREMLEAYLTRLLRTA